MEKGAVGSTMLSGTARMLVDAMPSPSGGGLQRQNQGSPHSTTHRQESSDAIPVVRHPCMHKGYASPYKRVHVSVAPEENHSTLLALH